MSFEDRYQYSDSSDGRSSSLSSVLGSSIQMFWAGGLQVRMNTWALLAAIVYLAIGVAALDFPQRLLTIGVLLVLVLLHESGHCLVTTLVHGSVDELLLWPLGGLVDARPPRRPLAVLASTLAGPAVNAAICAGCWLALRSLPDSAPVILNPFAIVLPPAAWSDPRFYLLLVFDLSYLMMLLNLLPVVPLDGGRVLQCALWPVMGYARSLVCAFNISVLLATTLALVSLAAAAWLPCCVMLACLVVSAQRRAVMLAAGVNGDSSLDGRMPRPRRHHLNRLAKWRARRQIRREEAESIRVDEILIKVYHSGMRSLSWAEKRLLRRATVRQRECAMEESSRQ